MPAIILMRGEEPYLTFNLDRAETRVGRGTLNDIVIPDEKVSRHHFVILGENGTHRIVDKSGRGVSVNGVQTAESALADKDEIGVGDTRFRFVKQLPTEGTDRNTNVDVRQSTDILSYSVESRSIVTTRGFLVFPGADGRRIELKGGVTNIGSAEETQVRIEEKYVSAFHCRIFKRGGRYFIRDLDSTNGTVVNGVRVVETELPEGAKIRLGRLEITFTMSEEVQRVEASSASIFQGMVGAAPAMKEMFELTRLVAPSDATVLVTGETGTGKELVARALHRLSGRSAGSFIPLNCAAIAKDIIESELFGHEKGSFSGAHGARKGAFEEADGGTLFLDEVAELPPDLQTKMLRAIEYGEVKRVGANRPIQVSVRVAAATNRDLAVEVAQGRFREDLYYRLSVIPIHLPPLRSRGNDVSIIADHLMAEMTARRKSLTPEAHDRLRGYQWPGNVRELKNVLTRALVLSKSARIGPADLSFKPAGFEDRVELEQMIRPGMTLAQIERSVILAELDRQGGQREKTAKALGIGYTTLKDKLRAWGVGGKKEE